MFGGRCSRAILDRTTPSSTLQNPLSLLFPLDTKTGGVHPPLWYDQPFHFGTLFSVSSSCGLWAGGCELLFSPKSNHSRTSRRLAPNSHYYRTYAKQGGGVGRVITIKVTNQRMSARRHSPPPR